VLLALTSFNFLLIQSNNFLCSMQCLSFLCYRILEHVGSMTEVLHIQWENLHVQLLTQFMLRLEIFSQTYLLLMIVRHGFKLLLFQLDFHLSLWFEVLHLLPQTRDSVACCDTSAYWAIHLWHLLFRRWVSSAYVCSVGHKEQSGNIKAFVKDRGLQHLESSLRVHMPSLYCGPKLSIEYRKDSEQ
jgi:hypothetical protein